MNRPKICGALISSDIDSATKLDPFVDLYEVRIDLIGDDWEKLVKQLKKPWIATNRTVEEGGKWNGNEGRRIEKLLRAIDLGAEMVDVEFKTKNLTNIVPMVKRRVNCILSYHDTVGTPSLKELKDIVKRQLDAGADICKVVTTAQNFEDNLRVLQLIRDFSQNRIVAFAMGPAGQTSRVLCPLVGGDFTYGSAGEGKESAPGQVTTRQLIEIYKTLGIN
ncbi:MAG: type I 3-dehydroquinate dehydratase [Dehalococcoidales bacterium]|nr:type I 3-dehydroquinate dehydratase [Dehalococcoidales bacterium]